MAITNLITLSEPRSTATEAYRTLRTNLMFSSVENPIHTLLVTSPAKDDKKSITLAKELIENAQFNYNLMEAKDTEAAGFFIFTLDGNSEFSDFSPAFQSHASSYPVCKIHIANRAYR